MKKPSPSSIPIMRRLIALFVSSVLLLLVACTITNSPSTLEPPTADIPKMPLPSSETPPSANLTLPSATLPSPATSATRTRKPTATIRPTSTPILRFANTPTPGTAENTAQLKLLIRDGIALPASLQPLTPLNINKLTEIARWGKGEIRDLAYTSDGSQVAAVTNQGIYFYSSSNYKLVRFIPANLSSQSIALSPNLQYVALGNFEEINFLEYVGELKLIDAQTGQMLYQLEVPGDLNILDFSFDNQYLFFEAHDNAISSLYKTYAWDIAQNTIIPVSHIVDGNLQFSPYHSLAFQFDGDLQIWQIDDPQTPQPIIRINNPGSGWSTDTAAISPDQTLIAIGLSDEMKVALYRLSDGQLLYDVPITPPSVGKVANGLSAAPNTGRIINSISSIVFSPDGERLAAMTHPFGTIHQIDVKTGQFISYARLKGVRCGRLAYSPDSSILAAWFMTASFYNANSNNLISTLPNHIGPICSHKFSPDGQTIAAGSCDAHVWVRQVEDGVVIRDYTGHEDTVSSIDFSPDGKYIASGSDDKTVRLWNVESRQSRILYQAPGWVQEIAFSHDGKLLAVRSFDHYSLPFINIEDGAIRFELSLPYWAVISLSPTQPLLAFLYEGRDENELYYYDLTTGKESNKISLPPFGYSDNLAFSTNGQWLAYIQGTYTERQDWKIQIILRSIQEENLTIALQEYSTEKGESDTTHLVFSPDNSLIAAATDENILIWDTQSGALLVKIPVVSINSLDFSPDGKLLAAGMDDGTIRIFAIRP